MDFYNFMLQQIPLHILTELADGTYDYEGSGGLAFHWIAEKLGRP